MASSDLGLSGSKSVNQTSFLYKVPHLRRVCYNGREQINITTSQLFDLSNFHNLSKPHQFPHLLMVPPSKGYCEDQRRWCSILFLAIMGSLNSVLILSCYDLATVFYQSILPYCHPMVLLVEPMRDLNDILIGSFEKREPWRKV